MLRQPDDPRVVLGSAEIMPQSELLEPQHLIAEPARQPVERG